jgi:hypothetical protein
MAFYLLVATKSSILRTDRNAHRQDGHREGKGRNDQGNALWVLDKKDGMKEEYRRIRPSHAPMCRGCATGLDGECDES